MTLRGQIVDFVGFDLQNQTGDLLAVLNLTIVKTQSLIIDIRIFIDVVDATDVKTTRASNHTVGFVVFDKQQLCEIRAGLASDAGNQGGAGTARFSDLISWYQAFQQTD